MPSPTVIKEQRALADGLLVRVVGEIVYSNAAQFRVDLFAALGAKPRRLVVDLAEVGYMDSAGLATLVEALQVQIKRDGKLVLYGLQQKVRGIVDIARLNTIFKIAATLDEAARM